MELRHLRYFVAAAEEEHFARAADRLCITRPAVSQIISDLEGELGTKLFERKAHRVKLTAAGVTLLTRLRRVLGDLTQALELTKRVGAGKAGVLNVGYGSLTLLHPIFRAAIKQVHTEYPEVTLSLFEMPTREQLAGLRAGTLHAGFTHSAAPENVVAGRGSHGVKTLFDENGEFAQLQIESGKLAVALPLGHPLAASRSLKLSDLANEDFVDVPLSSVSPRYGRLAAACIAAGFEPRVVQEVTNVVTQLNLVSVGMGIGIVVVLPGVSYPTNLQVVPLSGLSYSTKFQLLWSKQQRMEPVLEQFINVVQRLATRKVI
jgi:DNA-binding transcriptional LysR family regulator